MENIKTNVAVDKIKTALDKKLEKMKQDFILASLRNWKLNRSHPILKKYPAPKKGKVVWDSSKEGTFRKVYNSMTQDEIKLSKHIRTKQLKEASL